MLEAVAAARPAPRRPSSPLDAPSCASRPSRSWPGRAPEVGGRSRDVAGARPATTSSTSSRSTNRERGRRRAAHPLRRGRRGRSPTASGPRWSAAIAEADPLAEVLVDAGLSRLRPVVHRRGRRRRVRLAGAAGRGADGCCGRSTPWPGPTAGPNRGPRRCRRAAARPTCELLAEGTGDVSGLGPRSGARSAGVTSWPGWRPARSGGRAAARPGRGPVRGLGRRRAAGTGVRRGDRPRRGRRRRRRRPIETESATALGRSAAGPDRHVDAGRPPAPARASMTGPPPAGTVDGRAPGPARPACRHTLVRAHARGWRRRPGPGRPPGPRAGRRRPGPGTPSTGAAGRRAALRPGPPRRRWRPAGRPSRRPPWRRSSGAVTAGPAGRPPTGAGRADPHRPPRRAGQPRCRPEPRRRRPPGPTEPGAVAGRLPGGEAGRR